MGTLASHKYLCMQACGKGGREMEVIVSNVNYKGIPLVWCTHGHHLIILLPINSELMNGYLKFGKSVS